MLVLRYRDFAEADPPICSYVQLQRRNAVRADPNCLLPSHDHNDAFGTAKLLQAMLQADRQEHLLNPDGPQIGSHLVNPRRLHRPVLPDPSHDSSLAGLEPLFAWVLRSLVYHHQCLFASCIHDFGPMVRDYRDPLGHGISLVSGRCCEGPRRVRLRILLRASGVDILREGHDVPSGIA